MACSGRAGSRECVEPSGRGRSGELRAPTVITVGDLDDAALIASNEDAAKRIPGCELIRMAGVDHFPTVRAPELVADVMLRHTAAYS